MSRIFISYSRNDAVAARAIHDWLERNGWQGDVFLDDHPQEGIAGGEAWRNALRDAAGRCEAVLVLLSRSWIASKISWSEFEMAERFRKAILPIVLESELSYSEIPNRITGWYQLIDRAKSSDEDFAQRLQRALERFGAGPKSFPLLDSARPYSGLTALTERDAALFFGRDLEVLQMTELLREIRATGRQRIPIILGGSGSGKSSLLRAGVWPRLRRDDRNFLAVPVLRPGNAALSGETGLWRSLSEALRDQRWAAHLPDHSPRTPAAIEEAVCNAGRLDGLLSELHRAAATALLDSARTPPDLVFAVDQAEELFNLDGWQEVDRFLRLLRDLLVADPRAILLFTLRSDMFPKLQEDQRIPQDEIRLFNLQPMPATAMPQVITGPAERLGLTVDPRLTSALLKDACGADALPLLAFTLETIYENRFDDKALTLADYERMGGVRRAITEAAQKTRSAALAAGVAPQDFDAILRRSFIPNLVRINEAGEPARRVARRNEFDADCLSVIDLLVNQRLLVTGRDGDTPTAEIAHEAVLREWPEVAELVRQHRDFLAWREHVARHREAYEAGRGDLLGGRGLAVALEFLHEFGEIVEPEVRAFVAASQAAAERERAEREAERESARQLELQAERDKAESARRRVRQLLVFAVIASGLIVGVVLAGILAWNASVVAERESKANESLRLAAIAEGLIRSADWPAGRAVAWLALPHDAAMADRPITDEAATAIYRSPSRHILTLDGPIDIAYSPAGTHVLFASLEDGRIQLFNTLSETVLLDSPLRGWRGFGKSDSWSPSNDVPPLPERLPLPRFSADGRYLILVHGDGTVDVHQTSDGARVGDTRYDLSDKAIFVSREGRRLLRQTSEEYLMVLDLLSDASPLVVEREAASVDPNPFDEVRIDGLIEERSGRYLWLVKRGERGYPTFGLIDVQTGGYSSESSRFGNDTVFAYGPSGSDRLLICGFNNAPAILDIERFAAAGAAEVSHAFPAGLRHFIVSEADGVVLEALRQDNPILAPEDVASEDVNCAISGDGSLAVVESGDRILLYDMVEDRLEDVTGRYSPFLTVRDQTYGIALRDYSSIRHSSTRHGPVGVNDDGRVIYGITGSAAFGAGATRALVFHDVETGELLARIEVPTGVLDYRVDSAGRTAVVEGFNGAVSAWEVSSGVRLGVFRSADRGTEDDTIARSLTVALDPAGHSVLVHHDYAAELAATTRQESHLHRLRPDLALPIRLSGSLRAGHFLPKGGGLVLGTAHGAVELFGLDGRSVASTHVHDGPITRIVAGAAGEIVTGGGDGRLARLGVSGELSPARRVEAHSMGVSALATAPAAARIASGSQDGMVFIWTAELDAPALRLPAHAAAVSDLVFTASGSRLVSAGFDGRIALWDAATGAGFGQIIDAGEPVWRLLLLPTTDEVLIAGSGSGSVAAWRLPPAGPVAPLWQLDTGSRALSLAASPNGRYVAIGLEDGRALLLAEPVAKATEGAGPPAQLLDGHRSAVVKMVFLADGALLATAARDRTLRLWDIDSVRQIAVYDGGGTVLLDLIADTSGSHVATVFQDNLAELRHLPVAPLGEVIRQVSEAIAAAAPVSHTLCTQLRLHNLTDADRICASPE